MTFRVNAPRYARLTSPDSSEIMIVRESVTSEIPAEYLDAAQEAREKLMRREKELLEERQRAEAERQRFAADEQTLLARLSSLEMGMPGATHQSREARTVHLAPWMGLKK